MITLLKYICRSLFIVLFLSSCSSTPQHKGSSFDLSQVNKMAFKFKEAGDFLGAPLPQQVIRQTVVNNLSEWNYQFDDKSTSEHTHDLVIHIGSIHRGSTPSGLSFSSGSSNPRSLDFQKSTTIPLTCALMPKGQSSQSAELTMEVMADEYRGSAIVAISTEQMFSRLADDISTTCFNLLSSLPIKTPLNTQSSQTSPLKWMPKIRVEVENIVEDNTSNSAIAKEPRKRVIIHNQGTPVIFKFGPDR